SNEKQGVRAAELSSGPHALFAAGSCGLPLPGRGQRERRSHARIALPHGAAGGSYLGLAVPATAGDGDGTRTAADAAECRDAEQEQVSAGGRQAAARRRAGAHRRGGAAGGGAAGSVAAGRGAAAVGRATGRG